MTSKGEGDNPVNSSIGAELAERMAREHAERKMKNDPGKPKRVTVTIEYDDPNVTMKTVIEDDVEISLDAVFADGVPTERTTMSVTGRMRKP